MLNFSLLITMLVYAAAGFCLFLTLLNRVMILMPDGDIKNPTILGAFALLCGGGLLLGYFLHGTTWIIAPIMVLILAAISEIQRLMLRQRITGTKPVHNDGPAIDLCKPITTTDLRFLYYEVPHPKWHGSQLRIIHISDMHVTADLPLDYYAQAMERVAQLEPDITIFTGDFVTDIDALPLLKKVLHPIGRYGSFAAFGNHDYWAGADRVRDTILACNLVLIENTSIEVPVGEHAFVLSATDAPWGKQPIDNLATPENQLHIALSHTADNVYDLQKHNVNFVFSGHYHGGQFRIPFIDPIVIPSIYGRRFDQGHFVIEDTHLFVSAGLGSATPPLRIYCQPDILVVDIVATQ